MFSSKRIHSEPDRSQSKVTVCSGQSGELPFSCKLSADVLDSVFLGLVWLGEFWV